MNGTMISNVLCCGDGAAGSSTPRKTARQDLFNSQRRKIVYAADVNQKLLGDFIEKHNVRDEIFRESQDVVLEYAIRIGYSSW